ncbi:tRNA (adenosine(37)-N6)-threonylcarbamoyltransferase complex ATPase subunit type 1 TsaE [Thiospirillum jenense]|uniref:tRNA threonylcarbamoyladenosine biosynthesis protein TsaE n=1 Tax=Thiospirillum jenense TaxID=1653858 RepID=A0A839HDB8_9GAMM|nr:tRNA (adenosine(37)-N6)-threonylcarbamoyltransferase complex ATPase subunit type 1 TsaE [Thiospirillum jenense]MBB1125396.1 tRNA (adenosine(37)-N6)-threonylcarbamoyltransferase complex ATPase subunit type 1 TsaE [Thiospirillum jenense]
MTAPFVADCYLPNETAQLELGRALAPALIGRAGLIFLHGDLGAGKTTLVRGLLRGLGVTGTVRSPTYTLIEPYSIQLADKTTTWPLFHLDLYRLADPRELDELGWRDLRADGGLLLIEWPERGAPLLPAADVSLHLTITASARQLRASGQPSWAAVMAVMQCFSDPQKVQVN